MKSVVAVIVLVFLASTFIEAQQNETSLAQTIHSILHAKNAVEIAKAKAQNNDKYLIDVAGAYRAHQLGLPKSEEGLFFVLPHSSEQVSKLYSVGDLNYQNSRKEFVNLYENYYKTVFALAPKYPKHIRRLFAVASNYGGELHVTEGEWFCGLLHDLYEKIPRKYLLATADESAYRIMALTCAAGCVDTE